MSNIDIVLSPALWHLAKAEGKNIVIIDIFRATSTICAALNCGAKSVRPVMDLQETLTYKAKGYLVAGERDGLPIVGFDFGNSPLAFNSTNIKGKSLALTTTNGTKCFQMAMDSNANEIFAGAFSNISGLADFLKESNKDIVLFCAGWKDKINLEDSLYAGMLYNLLKHNFEANSDAVLVAESIYLAALPIGFKAYLENSSHFKRLSKNNAREDMEFCLQINTQQQIVALQNGHLVVKRESDLKSIFSKS